MEFNAQDTSFMRLAIEIATQDGADPSRSPIGSVVVFEGNVLAVAKNSVVEKRNSTAHAEMEAIAFAGRLFEKGELRGATLYSTLQPCGMCTMACIWAKVRRVVFGAGRADVHEMYFEARHIDTLQFVEKAYRNDLTIEGGLLRDECAALYFRPWDEVPADEQGNR